MGFFKSLGALFEILKSMLIFIIFAFVLIVIGFIYKHHEKIYPSTEDASLQADIIPVSTNIAGRVDQVLVTNNSLVQENQTLFTLNNTKETVAYNQAVAIAKQDSDTYQRYAKAGAVGGISNEKIENAQSAMEVSAANVVSTKYALDNTTIKAPRAGIITNFYLQKGQYLTPTTTVGGLIIKHSAWVQANILEPFIENIRAGQAVTFEFRMYPGIKFSGVVEDVGYGIQTQSVSNSMLPTIDPGFNWVYLSKRFPVRIKVLSEDPFKTTPFRVGATVNVTINTEKYVQNSNAH